MLSRGHKSAILLQSLKFEVLLESGANALLEGFTFEACAAFSAALERFYEFSLHVICIAHGMSEELFQKMYDEMARQSERQLGAFMMLYAVEFDEAHKLDKQIVEFRNGVIHKGVIPDLDEAKKFCSAVYEIIAGLYEKLSGKYSEHIRKLVGLTAVGAARSHPAACGRGHLSLENQQELGHSTAMAPLVLVNAIACGQALRGFEVHTTEIRDGKQGDLGYAVRNS